MKNCDMVYRSLEIIEGELKSEINVYSLSEKFGFSLYYFSRLFKGVTGHNLKSYILNRQISEGYSDIIKSDKKIIEIAFDYGFSTPESFSRAFYKIIGINPSKLRSNREFKPLSLLKPLTKVSIEINRQIVKKEPDLVTLDEILLVGIPFYYDLSQKNDLSEPWGHLVKSLSLIPNRKTPERYYQMQYWFPDQDPNFFYFFISVEVNKIDELPVQFTSKIIPEQSYLRFKHRGLANTVGFTYEYIYNTFLPQTEYKLPHLYNFEFYGDEYKGPYNEDSISEVYIPIESPN